MTTDTGIKFKVETSAKKGDQQLLEFITIDILKIEQQHHTIQYIVTLPMNITINRSFNKLSMPWERIHCHSPF